MITDLINDSKDVNPGLSGFRHLIFHQDSGFFFLSPILNEILMVLLSQI